GTPAARMPQVAGGAIKERAARLRALGEELAQAHLATQVGREHRVLLEGPRMGRTEQFTEVALAEDGPVGEIVSLRIKGQDGRQLLA
ncbi:MAG: tRNA (N(6)-L-threonylcarbamoyladenosine(37)-C(2))-methylthiotransferase MtaB, partial [Rhodobacteraceae bacterium]|nr:tRNA (N(6)-L-threonylcarbamoyladenosine(37)-C(2))-methylthiotransferase MtaB [Paracoccaceae bacterium]